MSVDIPTAFLDFAARSQAWAAWMDGLPRRIREVLAEWRLTPDGPVATGECAVVIPVVTPDRGSAVVKFSWPHEEQRYEHLALRAWAGNGAVELLRADPVRAVLLLERADPVDLTTVEVIEACEVVAGLYGRLHIPAIPQLDRLSGLAERWARELVELPSGAPVPRRYVEQAASLARDFAADAGTDGTLCHGDLHYFNVLAAQREPWLAIDPKPVSGEPAFEIAPLLWNRWDEVLASGHAREAIRQRFFTVVDTAGLDEDRARDWVIVRELVNVLWTINDAAGATLSRSDRETITNSITIAKAVQD